MKKYCLIILIAIIVYSCSSPNESNPVDTDLDKKIGQMLLIGFRGSSVDESSPIVKDIKSGRVGGVILFDKDVALGTFDRNIKSPSQVKNLNESLQNYASIPLIIAVDQEGGYVCRLKQSYGFPANVSQQYLGNLDNIDTTNFYANLTAQALKDCGFNLNAAPVVDLNVNPSNPVIGKIERSFSADPNIVIKHSSILINALHAKEIKCSLKHFPGHGSSTADSHLGIVDVTNTWSSQELLPYKELINSGYEDCVMTAHIYNANLDTVPATLSNKIITGILRNELNFKGIVLSDDMNMKAISDHYGLDKSIELAINAGVDILVFGNNSVYDEEIAQKAINIIKKLISEGKISIDRINESYNRIIKYKNVHFL